MTLLNYARKIAQHSAFMGASLATLLAPNASAQSNSQYTASIPGIPSRGSCVIDSVNNSQLTTALRIQGYDANGTILNDTTKTIPASGAIQSNLADLYHAANRRDLATIVLSSPNRTISKLTCAIPDAHRLLSSFTLDAIEYNSATTGFLVRAPTAALADQQNPAVWSSTLVIGGINQPITYTAASEQTQSYKVSNPLTSYGTAELALSDILPSSITSTNMTGNIKATMNSGSNTTIPAYQLFTEDGASYPIRNPSEEASRILDFEVVYPTATTGALSSIETPLTAGEEVGQARVPQHPISSVWRQVIGLHNTSSATAGVYATAHAADGTNLGTLNFSIPPNESLDLPTDTIVDKLPSGSNIASISVTSSQPLQGYQVGKLGSTRFSSTQYIATNAATPLARGRELVGTGVRADPQQMSTFALYNPGTRTETVSGTLMAEDGSVVSTAKFSIAPHAQYMATTATMFSGDLTKASYVRFKVTSAPTNPNSIDPTTPEGRISGVQHYQETGKGVFATGSRLQNVDALVTNLSSTNYNPHTNLEAVRFFSNPAVVSITARTGDLSTIVSSTYSPVCDPSAASCDTSKGFSAKFPSQTTGRQYFATQTTVNSVIPNDFASLGTQFHAVNGVAVLNDAVSIALKTVSPSGQSTSTTYTTKLSVQDRPAQYELQGLNGDGTSVLGTDAMAIFKDKQNELATLLSADPNIINLGNNQHLDYATLVGTFYFLQQPGTPNSISNIYSIDSTGPDGLPSNRLGLKVNSGSIAIFQIPKTSAGNAEMDNFNRLLGFGPNSYQIPPAGTVVTIPPGK